jgi:hypothetical protein
MADAFSSPIETETCTTDAKVHDGKNINRKLTPEQYHQLTDKLREIEQIKCEERLVYDELHRINAERQQLQDLLNILHVMGSNERINSSRFRHRRLQKRKSNARSN